MWVYVPDYLLSGCSNFLSFHWLPGNIKETPRREEIARHIHHKTTFYNICMAFGVQVGCFSFPNEQSKVSCFLLWLLAVTSKSVVPIFIFISHQLQLSFYAYFSNLFYDNPLNHLDGHFSWRLFKFGKSWLSSVVGIYIILLGPTFIKNMNYSNPYLGLCWLT